MRKLSGIVVLFLLFMSFFSVWPVRNGGERRLKILIVTPQFPKFIQPFILNQITGLIDRGHSVTILAQSRKDEYIHPDVEKYQLLQKTYYKSLPPELRTFDIILCNWGPSGLRALDLVKRGRLKGKLITCFRGDDISKRIVKQPDMYNELFREGDLFLTVCEAFKSRLIDMGCDKRKILVHHSAINLSDFDYRERYYTKGDHIKIVFVGRLVEKKGIEYAIRSVAGIVNKYPYVQFDIIGGGPLEKAYTKLIKELGVGDNIRLLGWIAHHEIVTYLNDAHIFLFPAITAQNGDQEGIPNALKEAMAVGLPSISTYHSGIPELIDNGVSGFLVSESSVEELTERIEYMIEHPEMWPVMSHAAREKVEQEHDCQKQNDVLVTLFKKLVRGRV